LCSIKSRRQKLKTVWCGSQKYEHVFFTPKDLHLEDVTIPLEDSTDKTYFHMPSYYIDEDKGTKSVIKTPGSIMM
jgi:hypothetical protein